MIELEKIFENQYLTPLLLMIFGAFVTLIFTKLSNKTSTFRYHVTSNKVGMSADDKIFGSVRSTWEGHEMRNLHLCTVEIENTTSSDFENVQFRVFSGKETFLLNQRTEVADSPYIIPWEEAFSNRIQISEGDKASKKQIDEYRHNREYELPVFNRGQIIRFSYLCTNPNDDNEPGVYVSTPNKGVKLKRRNTPYLIINPIFGVPIPAAISRALVIAILIVIACGIWIENVWLASGISMFVGLTGQIFGAIAYKIEKFITNTVAG